MVNLFASRLSLIAFATAACRGAMAGSQFEGTIKTSLVAGAVFYVVGLLCGELARRVAEEDARAEVERMTADATGGQE